MIATHPPASRQRQRSQTCRAARVTTATDAWTASRAARSSFSRHFSSSSARCAWSAGTRIAAATSSWYEGSRNFSAHETGKIVFWKLFLKIEKRERKSTRSSIGQFHFINKFFLLPLSVIIARGFQVLIDFATELGYLDSEDELFQAFSIQRALSHVRYENKWNQNPHTKIKMLRIFQWVFVSSRKAQSEVGGGTNQSGHSFRAKYISIPNGDELICENQIKLSDWKFAFGWLGDMCRLQSDLSRTLCSDPVHSFLHDWFEAFEFDIIVGNRRIQRVISFCFLLNRYT